MANESFAKIGIDDLAASAAEGVLRAMEARRVSVSGISAAELTNAGFNVELIIRAGGWPLPIQRLSSEPMPGVAAPAQIQGRRG